MSSRRPTAPRGTAARSSSRDAGQSASRPVTHTGGRARTSPARPRAARRAGAATADAEPAGGSGRPAPAGGPTAGTAQGGGSASSSASSTTAAREPRHVTLRALVLFVVVLVAFIVLMPTMRAYVAQQEQLRDVNADLEAARERTAELQAEYDRWQDPTYVQSQARERFHMVLPGETMYRVLDPETVTGEDPIGDVTDSAEEDQGGLVPDPDRAPWYVTVWDSVEVAGGAASDD